MFEDYNKMVEEHYRKRAQEWNDLVDVQIDKILDKIYSFSYKDAQLERSDIEDTIKECFKEVHSYTCEQMIDIDEEI